MPTHHRDVARMIMDAILLLEARLMRFVDDDHAEMGVGQEQRRARADDDLRLARRDAVPGASPLGRTEARVPCDGLAAEARRAAGQHRFGESSEEHTSELQSLMR